MRPNFETLAHLTFSELMSTRVMILLIGEDGKHQPVSPCGFMVDEESILIDMNISTQAIQ